MKISRREKYVLYFGGGFALVLILIFALVFPIVDKRDRLKRSLANKNDTLADMLLLKAEYDALKTKAKLSESRLKGRERNFKLLPHLYQLAEKAKIKKNIDSMKPSPSKDAGPYRTRGVQMNIKAVTLRQLAPFLHKVETSRNMLSIKRISIKKKGKAEGFVDALLHVETFEIAPPSRPGKPSG